jgi:UDP-N-acetylmuramate--alanine ligase
MKHIHLIGIGGTGLSAIARILLQMGYTVSGSDRAASPLSAGLQVEGVNVMLGHSPENIQGADLVIRSSAIPDDNPEVQAARAAGLPVLKRADFLGQLMENHLGIAVAGTHGKTTTTAMIAWMLVSMGQQPSFIVGGVMKNLSTNAQAGKGLAFVIEADEYDRMFLGLSPRMAVITNIEHDHPDSFPTPQDYMQAFHDFIERLPTDGTLLVCADDEGSSSLLKEPHERHFLSLSYGLSAQADYQALDINANTLGGFTFTAYFHEADGSLSHLANLSLQVPGIHNIRNALAALAVAHLLGLSTSEAAKALEAYLGAGRRFDVIGTEQGITVIDDYAHHPTEIRTTLAAARARYPGQRLWVVWQPHTYSRTQAMLADFASAFSQADRVIVTEIYAAREPELTFSAAQVVRNMSHPGVVFIPSLPAVSAHLLNQLKPGDVLLVLSAGDADQVSAQVLSGLQIRKETHDQI